VKPPEVRKPDALPKASGIIKRGSKQNPPNHREIPPDDIIRPNKVTTLDADGSRLLYLPNVFSEADPTTTENKDHLQSKALFRELQNGGYWQQGFVKLFGKEIAEPRLTCYFGDHGYKYSGRQLSKAEYPAAVRKIKDAVEARLKAWFEEHQEGNSDLPLPLSRLEFNSVLLNRYRGGEDSQGWHSDNEAVYGRDPVIASVSFGCEREFCFRHCKDHKRKRSLVLEHGSLLLMFGPIQHHWQHCLPKRKKVQGERINLTFRQVVVGVGS